MRELSPEELVAEVLRLGSATPADQVAVRYRNLEREAYRRHRDAVPGVLAAIGHQGRAGHVGSWHPSELHPDYRPDALAAAGASGAALAFLRGLGYGEGEDRRVLAHLLRWCRGEYSRPEVAAVVDDYARRPGARYHGPIIRAIDLPPAADGRPDLSRFNPTVVRDVDSMMLRASAGDIGLRQGLAYESPVPRSYAASASCAGNLYEVVAEPHSAASLRAFSPLWGQDEVVLPAHTRLRVDRISQHNSPGEPPFVVVYSSQVDRP